ncbi:hypothetical protein MYCFIDRAFT_148860 [Lecanosticta acicola]|uniref:Tetraspanin Tsp3 n=1 Tax=Lecanosticta acicola TaxID=111012 RepID=A0AAI8Z896_9PEZI|nr:hypothetical protein MYCFIDRAFT_148860 [Lecanosticta acicola]
MARFTKRQIITSISVLFLAALTALAAYATYKANIYSLPIPNTLGALTVALPPLAGIALECIVSFQSQLATKGALETSKVFQAVNAFFLVYETVLATLAGTHIAPAQGLWCPLHEKWNAMWRTKDATSILRIQDAFGCCGFNSPRDMAFPFQDKTHRADACMVRYERNIACVEPWRTAERRVAIIMLVVPLAVFTWKVVLFLAPGSDTHWLPSAIRLPREQNGSRSERPRPAITFRNVEDGEDADSLRDEVDRLNKDSNLASRVESGRVRSTPLIQETENNMWRE